MGVGLVALAIAVAAAIWALLARGDREPTYEGRTLSYWLKASIDYSGGYPDPQKAMQATNAVRHIGTNALPWLVKWLGCKVPQWRNDLFAYVPRQAFDDPRLARKLIGPDGTHLWLSLTGFEILGEEAAPALPALIALAGNWEAETRSINILTALSHLGNIASTSLVSIVTNTSLPTPQRATAVRYLAVPSRWSTTNLTWAIPALARCVNEPIDTPALETMATLASASPSVVSKLLEACCSTDAMTRQGATNALRFIAPAMVKEEP